MDLQQVCEECVYKLRIGDTDFGINIILTCMPQIQERVQQLLNAGEQTESSQMVGKPQEIVRRLEKMIRCIENKDGVGLADVLEYEIKEMLE